MAKQSLKQSSRQIQNGDAVGKEVQQELTLDDCFLPSPSELAQYKDVDSQIVKLLCDMSRKEQENRHSLEQQKIKIVRRAEGRDTQMNFWGMFFAFFALISMLGVAAFALYLDHPWFASIFSGATIISIISIFVSSQHSHKN